MSTRGALLEVQIIKDGFIGNSSLESLDCVLTLWINMQLFITKHYVQIFNYKPQCNQFFFSLMCTEAFVAMDK